MSNFKIPSFLSLRFASAKSKDEKDTLVKQYKNWYNNEITQDFIKALEKQVQDLQEEEDSRTDFASLFQSKYTGAHYKGQKKILRKIIKQLKY